MQHPSTPLSMRSRRRLAEVLQALLIVGLPFVTIGGESALRFDIPSLRLHVFGATLWMDEFFLVLVSSIFILLLTIFITLVFGRIWCGWLCPQTVIIDFLPPLEKRKAKGAAAAAAAYVLTLLVSILVAASLIWYFILPAVFLRDLAGGRLGEITWGFWIVMTGILFLNFAFLRHKWCATVCPYAKLQSVLFDKSTLTIELDPAREADCIDCKSCIRACPTGVDIRKGLDAACINCAECIDACSNVMTKLRKQGLIHYAFGSGGQGKILRQSVLLIGALTLVFFAFIVYLAGTRTGLDVAVLPHSMEPRLTRDGRVINAYVISLKNRRTDDLDLRITVEKFDDDMTQSLQGVVHIAAGKSDRIPLFVKTKSPGTGRGAKTMTIVISDAKTGITLRKEAPFVFPNEV